MNRIIELGPIVTLSLVLIGPGNAHRACRAESDSQAPEPSLLGQPPAELAILADLPSASATDLAGEPKTEVIKERYPNSRVKIRRDVTQDEEGNYVNHGTWQMWDSRGNRVAEGRYQMGEREGTWTRWHARSDSKLFNNPPFNQAEGTLISQAQFANGVLHGDWVIYDAKQRKLSRITFEHGKRHGPMTLWLPSGVVYQEMSYQGGALHGDVYELGSDGKPEKVATYQNGRRLAKKITNYEKRNARKHEAMYLFAKLVPKSYDDFWSASFATYEPIGEDERHGRWITQYSNGQVMVDGRFENDVPVGQFVWWYANGQKMTEGSYADGKQQGRWTWWHDNGQKATQGEFTGGEQSGKWLSWDKSGKLDQHAVFGDSRAIPRKDVAQQPGESTAEPPRR